MHISSLLNISAANKNPINNQLVIDLFYGKPFLIFCLLFLFWKTLIIYMLSLRIIDLVVRLKVKCWRLACFENIISTLNGDAMNEQKERKEGFRKISFDKCVRNMKTIRVLIISSFIWNVHQVSHDRFNTKQKFLWK